MDVPPEEIGFAGLKDAQALTSQFMTLEHADVHRLAAFGDDQVRGGGLRHTNKLKSGHLAGNAFAVKIRGVPADKLPVASAILDVLLDRGVPNYFGQQRFGARSDTDKLGELLVRNTLDEFIALYLGRSIPTDPPDCKAARDAFDSGFYDRALARWPRHYANDAAPCQRTRRKNTPARPSAPSTSGSSGCSSRLSRAACSTRCSRGESRRLTRFRGRPGAEDRQRRRLHRHRRRGGCPGRSRSRSARPAPWWASAPTSPSMFPTRPVRPSTPVTQRAATGRERLSTPASSSARFLAEHNIGLDDFRHVANSKIKALAEP